MGFSSTTKLTLGLLAGAGEYPLMVVQGARRAGVRVVCAGFRGATGRDLPPLCDVFRLFRVGAVEKPRDFFREQGVTHVMMAGQIKPACIYTMWPDATARRLLASMDRRNAHTVFGAVCRYAQQECGWEVLPSTTFMEDFLPAAGHLAGPSPTSEQMQEAEHGLALARRIARLDIGQSLIVRGDRVVCVEGYKGTNECIREGTGSPDSPTTLCKVSKPGHDMRFDVPCIGLDTIRHCIRCHVRHIALQAHSTIIFQREQVLRLCNEHGILLHAVDLPAELEQPLPSLSSDRDHALFLARELDSLGIGSSAVVCEGVVIAVEDPDGLAKCLRRAGRYMKRIRFIRLVNFLIRLLLHRSSTPPSPPTLATLRPLSSADQKLARKYGITF